MSEEVNPNPVVYPPGATKYFLKEIVSNPVHVKLPTREGGQVIARVPFEEFGDDVGGIALTDPVKISALRSFAKARRGGVREVSEEEYNAAKKVASVQEQRRASLRPKSLLNQLVRLDVQRDPAAGKPAEQVSLYPDPSIPDQMAKVSEPVVVPTAEAPAARTPKPRRKSIPVATETPALPTPPLSLSGATVEP